MNAPVRQPIAFIDLAAQQARIGGRIEEAIRRVLQHGAYIMGPEVRVLEQQLSAFCGAGHTVTCANGTDAIAMVLMAKGVKAGDAVLVPSFTFAATAEVVAWVGATPVFVDVDPETFNMDPASLELGIATTRKLGLTPRAVIPVDLFGQPADYDALEPIARAEHLFVICDAAQSFGARYGERRVGGIGLATTTSFFPAKPLGCYGDGGAIFTDDDDLAAVLRSLRVHGQGTDKYDNVHIGMNGRLDTIQAAILIEKLAIFADEIAARNEVARHYDEALADLVRTPQVASGNLSVWAQYTLRVDAARRDALAAALKAEGVPTAVYYPKPLHRQTAYKAYPVAGNGLAVSDALASEVLSLPMHPYLGRAEQERVVTALRAALSGPA